MASPVVIRYGVVESPEVDRPPGRELAPCPRPAPGTSGLRVFVAFLAGGSDTARLPVPGLVTDDLRVALEAVCAPDGPAEALRPVLRDCTDASVVLRALPFPPAAPDLRAALVEDDLDPTGAFFADFAAAVVPTDLPAAMPVADLAADLDAFDLLAADLPVAGLLPVARLADFAVAPTVARPRAVFAADSPALRPLVVLVDLLAPVFADAVLVAGVWRATVLPTAAPRVGAVVAALLPAVRATGGLRPAADPRAPVPDADFVVAVFFATGLIEPVFLAVDLRGLLLAMRVSGRLVAPLLQRHRLR